MLAYFTLQFNILLLLLLRKLTKIKQIIYLIVVFLILFSGLRYGIGVDYFSYYEHFLTIFQNKEIKIEPGIILIAKIVHFFNLDIQMVFFILASITVICFMKYIEYFTKNNFISWIIFVSYGTFFLGSLNLVKQYVAISIFAFSLRFVYNKQPIKYILSITVATLFHYSAILLFPMYFLNIRFRLIHYFIIAIIFYITIHYIDNLIMMTKYSIYLDSKWANTMNNNRNFIMVYIFILLNIVIIMFSSKLQKTIDGSYIFVNMSFISLLLMFSAIIIDYLPNMFFFRINNYFMIAYIMLPTYFLYGKNKYIRIILNTLIILIMYTYFYVILYYKGAEYHLVPYLLNNKLF